MNPPSISNKRVDYTGIVKHSIEQLNDCYRPLFKSSIEIRIIMKVRSKHYSFCLFHASNFYMDCHRHLALKSFHFQDPNCYLDETSKIESSSSSSATVKGWTGWSYSFRQLQPSFCFLLLQQWLENRQHCSSLPSSWEKRVRNLEDCFPFVGPPQAISIFSSHHGSLLGRLQRRQRRSSGQFY